MAEYNYDAIATAAAEKLNHMCWIPDWVREDLPLENSEGTALDLYTQELFNRSLKVPKSYDNFVKPSTEKIEFPTPEQPKKENVLIFSDSVGYCKAIFESVPDGRVGFKKVVDNWEDLAPEDVKSLLTSQKGGWDLVVFAAGMDPPESNATAHIIDKQSKFTKLYFHLLQLIQRTEAAKKLCVLTRGVFSEDPSEHKKYGLGMTTGAILFGMSNSARLELEETSLMFMDTEFSQDEARKSNLYKRLASELFREQTFAHCSVRVLNEGRFVLRQVSSVPYEKAGVEFVVPSSGVIGIGGGNGALGLVMGEWLLDKAAKDGTRGFTIQFLSRSMKISDLNMPAWKAIQSKADKLGVKVEQAKLDVSTQDNVDKWVKANSPNITGFIHSAGVLRDSMLANLTWEKCEEVFDSKHRAALFLHSSFERMPNKDLSFLWMFSSVAVWGNMGQINYSGSNSYLDALARHRRCRGKIAQTMQWGAWGDVGMAATMSDSMRARTMASPMPYFSNAEGLQGMECGLRCNLPYFSVFKMNPQMMIGMIQPAEHPVQCYMRNFTCEIAPTPLPASLERKHMYTSLRMSNGGFSESQTQAPEKWLTYNKWVKPCKDKLDAEWGDDFRKW